MAAYQWADAVTYVKPFVKNIPTSALDLTACDTLHSAIWRYWFWKWAMASLTPIAAVDGTQDYSIANADFYRLYRARLTQTSITPNVVREKDVVSFLSPNKEQQGGIDAIQAVSYIDAISKLRLDRAASVPSGVTWQIDGDYQKQPTKLTTTATDIPFSDLYFDVALEALKWKYYQLGDDPRAGTQVITREGHVTYSGQLGTFMTLLDGMARAEGKGYGDSQRFPSEPLGVGRTSNPGLFGWY